MAESRVALNAGADGLPGRHENLETSGIGWSARDGISVRGCRFDPASFDFDGDQLSDGQEVQGWTINIVHEKTKDKLEERHVQSNPRSRNSDDDDGVLFDAAGAVDPEDLDDFEEFQATADPNNPDTDHDGILDAFEEPGGHWQVEGKELEIVGPAPSLSSGRAPGSRSPSRPSSAPA